MTRGPYKRNSNERTNQEVKKAPMFIIFGLYLFRGVGRILKNVGSCLQDAPILLKN